MYNEHVFLCFSSSGIESKVYLCKKKSFSVDCTTPLKCSEKLCLKYSYNVSR